MRPAAYASAPAPNGRYEPLAGEKYDQGRIYHVSAWHTWSDRRKIQTMRRMVEDYGADPRMRWFTASVLERAGVPPRDFQAQAAALLRFVQHEIYYTNETNEQIQSPWRTLKVKTGDCFAAGTLVLRDDYELVPIEDVKVGDRIWGYDKWSTVEAWADKGDLPIWSIRVASADNGDIGRGMWLTPDHKVYVKRADGQVERIRVRSLAVGDVLLRPSDKQKAPAAAQDWKLRSTWNAGLVACTFNPQAFAADGIEAEVLAIAPMHAVPCYDIQTDDHYVHLPLTNVTVSNCDDLSILLASMAESIALPWRFALGGHRKINPKRDRQLAPLVAVWERTLRDPNMPATHKQVARANLEKAANQRVRWIEGQPWPSGARFSHVYVMLGWPPFDPQRWAAAEPTVRGMALGQDVVLHGLPAGANGGRDLAGWGSVTPDGSMLKLPVKPFAGPDGFGGPRQRRMQAQQQAQVIDAEVVEETGMDADTWWKPGEGFISAVWRNIDKPGRSTARCRVS